MCPKKHGPATEKALSVLSSPPTQGKHILNVPPDVYLFLCLQGTAGRTRGNAKQDGVKKPLESY